MKTWLITDTHLWHEWLTTGGDRPENFTSIIFKMWKQLVAADDLVIHLGDVTFRAKTLKDELAVLPGRKVLIRGNHDSESIGWYMRNGFDFACDSMVFKKVLLTHAPANELSGRALLNVHGHLHANAHRLKEYVRQPFHKLLAIENTGYAPVSFDKFVGALPVSVPI